MEVATKNSESQLVARLGVMNVSREWSRKCESQMRVASGVMKHGSRMWVANVSHEMGS